jgi:hypothetical protein
VSLWKLPSCVGSIALPAHIRNRPRNRRGQLSIKGFSQCAEIIHDPACEWRGRVIFSARHNDAPEEQTERMSIRLTSKALRAPPMPSFNEDSFAFRVACTAVIVLLVLLLITIE